MYERLPAKSISDVLLTLWQASSTRKLAERPLVTLSLPTGSLTGRMVNFQNRELLIQPADRNELTYLSLGSVWSLTLHDPEPWCAVLSEGKIDPLSLEPPVGKLDLKRKVAATVAVLTNHFGGVFDFVVDWDSLPQSENSPKSVQAFLDDFVSALTRLTPDAESRTLFLNHITATRLAHGDRKAVTMSGKTLEICFPTDGGSSERYTANDLYDALNRLF